jgi:hypothetical protein
VAQSQVQQRGRLPIWRVEIKASGGSIWHKFKNTYGIYMVIDYNKIGFGLTEERGPFSVRLTADNGAKVWLMDVLTTASGPATYITQKKF